MKKTLLAAALLAGFATAGVAQAETSVTLYGIVDTGVGYTRTSGTMNGPNGSADVRSQKWGMVNGVENGSRWGMKGVEDLGNGLNAVFVLESGFDSSTGKSAQGGRLFGRQATIGLQSDAWGRLDLGRQTNIASKFAYEVMDPFLAAFRNSEAGSSFQSVNTYRIDNQIQYMSPDISGFKFGIGYSWNADGSINPSSKVTYNPFGVGPSNSSTSQSSNNSQEFNTGLRYVNGPIGLMASYDLLRVGANVPGNDSTGTTSVQEWNLGGSYDFEVVKAYLGVGQMKNGVFGAGYTNLLPLDAKSGYANQLQPVMNGFRATSYLVGLSAPIGAGTVMADWQMSDPKRSDDGVQEKYGVTNKMNIYSLGYIYKLSKRTHLYAYGSYTQHALYQNDLKTTDLGIGLRHAF